MHSRESVRIGAVDRLLRVQPLPNQAVQRPSRTRLPLRLLPRLIPLPLLQVLTLIPQLLLQHVRPFLCPILPREHLWAESIFICRVRVCTTCPFVGAKCSIVNPKEPRIGVEVSWCLLE